MSDYFSKPSDDDELPLFKVAAKTTEAESIHVFVKRTTSTSKQAKLLFELKIRGFLSTVEAEHEPFHRGQATIRELRKRGHIIETVMRNGVKGYVHVDYVPLIDVGEYKELYYTTKHWKKIAAKRREIDGFACKQCGSKSSLEVHHHVYNLFEEDVLRDLITFCSDCHQRVHEGAKNSQLHFPEFLAQSILDRIKSDQVTADGAESWN